MQNDGNTRNPLHHGDLIITVGLPLSGKSTLVEKCSRFTAKVAVVCPDTIRLAMHGNQFIDLAEPFVWATAQIMARTLLKQGYTVIIDATNTTVERRKMWRHIAWEFGKTLVIYNVDTTGDVCRERNRAISRLDEKIINRMEKQLQVPTSDEGIMFSSEDVEKHLRLFLK
ncbi:putative kinase [Anaerospora hongkongensis]|uniref:Putative kinase n=1 Tax=Anaerospora hongkongensis TaxID=244830 RepID=A0A4R1Q4F9_9FIRM|nr:ATP-binding protein [Anaerospora hongkongensis]TCL39964.1 putative kinase [Anaerospora hongkongensis]